MLPATVQTEELSDQILAQRKVTRPPSSFLSQVQVYCMQSDVLNDKPLMTFDAIFTGYQNTQKKKEERTMYGILVYLRIQGTEILNI